jgi:hypothetical protein
VLFHVTRFSWVVQPLRALAGVKKRTAPEAFWTHALIGPGGMT